VNSAAPKLLFLALLSIFPPSPSPADATLSGLDSPDRVPGSFVVFFKTGVELAALVRYGPVGAKVLPRVLPTSEGSARRLAEALCKRVHGKMRDLGYGSSYTRFVVDNASETLVREILAKDPRIAQIRALEPVVMD
jgi:hypothetical protein